MTPHGPVYLSALGMINSLGDEPQAIARRLRDGVVGLSRQTRTVAGRHLYVGAVERELAPITGNLARFDCRNNRLLKIACDQLQAPLKQLMETLARDRIGVVIGTSTVAINEAEKVVGATPEDDAFPADYHFRNQEMGSAAEFVRDYLELTGVVYSVSTACSSSARALASARNLIRSGVCDAVIAGGGDSLCGLTLNGFSSLEAVSEAMCRPFDSSRDGINIGEGAALFLVTRAPADIALLGVGESSDAHHISAPEPEGKGAEAAMRAALKDGAMAPEAVDYINLHGTGTPKNDIMEALAVNRVFGDQIIASSSKSQIGHLLGGAGATELALCYLALCAPESDAWLPPQVGLKDRDPALPALNLVPDPSPKLDRPPAVCLSNSFAFGGNNISMILGRTL